MPEPEITTTSGERSVAAGRWWGSFSIDVGKARRWRVGPMRIWIARTDREWSVTHEHAVDPFESGLAVGEPSGDHEEPSSDASRLRFGLRKTTAACRVLPALPDRALVVKPEEPFCLPPGEENTLFISQPLWFGIHVGTPSARLCEIPVFRPSDTWFGPPTLEGGSCYASRPPARVNFEDLRLLPQRAVSVVHVHNHAESELVLDRIRLPSPNLSLFASQDGLLWTETVMLERKEDGQSASVELGGGPSAEIGPTDLVAGPREPLEEGLLMRAFGGLL